MVSVIVFLIAIVFLYWCGLNGLRILFQYNAILIAKLGKTSGNAAEFWGLVSSMAQVSITMLVPFFLVLILLDALYTQHEFAKKMRMSKRDVKDEAKNRDGDRILQRCNYMLFPEGCIRMVFHFRSV